MRVPRVVWSRSYGLLMLSEDAMGKPVWRYADTGDIHGDLFPPDGIELSPRMNKALTSRNGFVGRWWSWACGTGLGIYLIVRKWVRVW